MRHLMYQVRKAEAAALLLKRTAAGMRFAGMQSSYFSYIINDITGNFYLIFN